MLDPLPSPSPGPDFSPVSGEVCDYCGQPRGSKHAPDCLGQLRHPLSVRLTLAEYDELCVRAVRAETDVTALVRRAIRILLRVTPRPPRKH